MARRSDTESAGSKLISGAVGGAVGTLATAPITTANDTMRMWKASPKGATAAQRAASKSMISTARQILKERGVKGLYNGVGGSLVKIVPAMGITFAAGDYVKRQIEKHAMPEILTQKEIDDLLSGIPSSPSPSTRSKIKPRSRMVKGVKGRDLKSMVAGGAVVGLGMLAHSALKKEASHDDNHTSKAKRILQRLAPPALAAAGAFMIARGGKLNKTVAQRASGGKFTVIQEDPTLFNKVLGRVSQGAKVMSTKDAIKSPKPLKGTFYADADQSLIKKIKFDKRSIVYNKADKAIDRIFQDKLRFGKLKSNNTSKTWSIHEHTNKAVHATPEDLARHLASIPGTHYYKPRTEFASGGKTHTSSEKIRASLKRGKVPRVVKQMHAKPDNFIAQEHIDLEIKRGKPRTENRVHFMTDPRGRVTELGPAMKRWRGRGEGIIDKMSPARAVHAAEVRKVMQKMINQNASLKKAIKGKRLALGADAVRDKNGKLVIVEVNDQSGFMHNPIIGPKMHKALTGRDTHAVAGLKAGVTGTAVAGAGMLMHKRKKS